MNPIIRNIASIVTGWAAGSAVNMGLVQLGHTIFPIDGLDPTNMESLASMMPTLPFQYFIFPFLAHALGTLVGACVAFLMAASHQMKFAMGIGALFLIGGIFVNYLIPGPNWFTLTDLILGYIPMAYIGASIGKRLSNKNRSIN